MNLDNIDIEKFLSNLKDEKERREVIEILQEYASTGKSQTLEQIMLQDYDEIPVDVETFIKDPMYMGKSYVDDNGKCIIYDFWVDKLKEIFHGGKNNYQEVIFTGGIGLGKTTIAVIGASYVLYKLMCLKNPQEYYQLKSNAKIYIAFFNITLELSYGVAYKDMMSALIKSPWFMSRGTVTGRKNLVYNPGKGIAFTVGSKPEHGLGRDIFCMHPLTKVKTESGYVELQSLKDKWLKIHQYSISKDKEEVGRIDSNIISTDIVKELYKITLEDGSEILLSEDHEVMLSDNSYKQAMDLRIGDNLKEVDK